MKSLLITLGHNSSAIFVDGDTLIGYEEERLTGIKSDSQFPIDAINEIIKNVGLDAVMNCKTFISHWFDFAPTLEPNKYISEKNLKFLQTISNEIVCVSPEMTHHDAHAYSGKAFFNYHMNHLHPQQVETVKKAIEKNPKVHVLVADGFGNEGEVLSIYEMEDYTKNSKDLKLVKRVYGYENSIGLLYQYATSYVGMKENEDEYKFLGYEAHIDEYLDKNQIKFLDSKIEELTNVLWTGYQTSSKTTYMPSEGNIINFKRLEEVKRYFHYVFQTCYENVWGDKSMAKYSKDENTFIQRTIVAYVLQQTVEHFFTKICKEFSISNAIVVGGSFYNVKLNNCIFHNIDGLFCAMPLAGDQGAAIGMYDYYTNEQFNFETLCIGKRSFYAAEKVFKNDYHREGTDELAKEIARHIADGKIVNLVHGNLEFGPRALMHTSSLFIPSVDNTAQNNSNNLRNEVMPCAPVLLRKNANILFGQENIDRVIGSDEFMILTHEYKRDYSKLYGGVMHKIVLQNGYSGRPQIVREGTFEEKILMYLEELCDIKCIVNTSFNKHGTPILFRLKQIRDDHNFQVEHSKLNGYKQVPLIYVIED